MDILLNDLFQFTDDETSKVVVRFNDKNDAGARPIEDWLLNKNESLNWTYHRNHKFFDNEILVSLFNISGSSYLLVAVDKINGKEDELGKIADKKKACALDRKCVKPIEKYSKYVGRLIVQYDNKVRGGSYSYQLAKNGKILPQCYIKEILPEEYSISEFCGFKNVDLSFKMLQYICDEKDSASDWRAILSTHMGVYLITDINEKKLYVGSAYGKEMILHRWRDYASTCHGGNKLLKQLFNQKGGKEYFEKYMRYSILEYWSADDFTNINYAVERENHWKKILCSKDIGYNAN